MNLNIMAIGQSNASKLYAYGDVNMLAVKVEYLLGFDGIANSVNVIGGDLETAYSGTGLITAASPTTPPWLTANPMGWTQGVFENDMLSYLNGLTAATKAAPTAVIYIHNESDVRNIGLTSANWASAIQYEAADIRHALGQTAETTPYTIVHVPYDWNNDALNRSGYGPIAQQEKLGFDTLLQMPDFNGTLIHAADLDMNGDGIDGGQHISPTDGEIVIARLAKAIANQFYQYALPGSVEALSGGHLDAEGPQAIAARPVFGSPNQLDVEVQLAAASNGLAALGGEAMTGLGWSIVDNGVETHAIGVTVIGGIDLRLTFATPINFDRTARVYYGYGSGRIAETNGPGQDSAVYDDQGMPIWTAAAGLGLNSWGTVRDVSFSSHPASVIYGTSASLVVGASGNDQLVYASQTSTYFQGGTGASTIVGGASGTLSVNGGLGSVVVWANGASAVATGGHSGNDILAAGSGSSILCGSYNDVFIGGSGAATIAGGGGSNVLFGGSSVASNLLYFSGNGSNLAVANHGTMLLVNGPSVDTLYGSQDAQSKTIVFGGAGQSFAFAGSGETLMVTSTGASTIIGGSGNMYLFGSTGSDVVWAGSGATFVDAGAGNDTIATGAGSLEAITGPGNAVFLVQGGQASIFEGSGSVDYLIGGGSPGGHLDIRGFEFQKDFLTLLGPGSHVEAISGIIAAAVDTSSGISMTMPDGVNITLVGLHSVTDSIFS